MSVGVMEDYKLRDLRASHTLGWSYVSVGVMEDYKLRDLRASHNWECLHLREGPARKKKFERAQISGR
jgi:hypothetical protein